MSMAVLTGCGAARQSVLKCDAVELPWVQANSSGACRQAVNTNLIDQAMHVSRFSKEQRMTNNLDSEPPSALQQH